MNTIEKTTLKAYYNPKQCSIRFELIEEGGETYRFGFIGKKATEIFIEVCGKDNVEIFITNKI